MTFIQLDLDRGNYIAPVQSVFPGPPPPLTVSEGKYSNNADWDSDPAAVSRFPFNSSFLVVKLRVRLQLNPFVIKMGFVCGAVFNHNRKPSLLFNCGVMRTGKD